MPNLQFPLIQAQKVQNIWNRGQGMLDDGSYFVATNPTPGTPITMPITASETQTSPMLLMNNSWTPTDPNAKNIYPVALRITVVGAPTSAAFWRMSIRTDASNPLKYTSGGTQITPVPAGVASNVSKAILYFGAITALAETNGGRLISSQMIAPTIPLAADVHNLEFGWGTAGPVVNAASLNSVRTVSIPPIAIPPGGWMALQMWGTSYATTAATFEFQLEYVER